MASKLNKTLVFAKTILPAAAADLLCNHKQPLEVAAPAHFHIVRANGTEVAYEALIRVRRSGSAIGAFASIAPQHDLRDEVQTVATALIDSSSDPQTFYGLVVAVLDAIYEDALALISQPQQPGPEPEPKPGQSSLH